MRYVTKRQPAIGCVKFFWEGKWEAHWKLPRFLQLTLLNCMCGKNNSIFGIEYFVSGTGMEASSIFLSPMDYSIIPSSPVLELWQWPCELNNGKQIEKMERPEITIYNFVKGERFVHSEEILEYTTYNFVKVKPVCLLLGRYFVGKIQTIFMWLFPSRKELNVWWKKNT